MIRDLKQIDDLSLHDMIFEILKNKTNFTHDKVDRNQLIAEAMSRDDIVLVTAAVELSETTRTPSTLNSIRMLIARRIVDTTLGILLLDELAARVPDANCEDFQSFLDTTHSPEVRRFCAKIFFYDEIRFSRAVLENFFIDEKDFVVRSYLAGCLFRQTGDGQYITVLGKMLRSQKLDAARIAKEVITYFGL